MSDKSYTQEQNELLDKVAILRDISSRIAGVSSEINSLVGVPWPISVMPDSCLLCKWNIRNTCRINPPSMPQNNHVPQWALDRNAIDPRWPRVFPDDVCGEFTPREGGIPIEIQGREKSYMAIDRDKLGALQKYLGELWELFREVDGNKGLVERYENKYYPFEFLRETTGDGK